MVVDLSPGRTIVLPALFPGRLFLIFEVRDLEQDDHHAKCGVTWCEDLSSQHVRSVEPARIPDRVAAWYDLHQELLWPLRPPVEAGPQRILRYRYLVHSWKDGPMPRSWITELLLANHEDKAWFLSVGSTSILLDGFDPSLGPPCELEVAAVMTA